MQQNKFKRNGEIYKCQTFGTLQTYLTNTESQCLDLWLELLERAGRRYSRRLILKDR